MRSLFLDALAGKNLTSAPPIWIMRQAGRYLPEYRSLREKYSFSEMYHTKELIAEVTLQPLKRYDFDAAILFSDILVVLEAMGRVVEFIDGKGPVIADSFSSKSDLYTLKTEGAVESLRYVYDGIKEVLPKLNVPLIGFAGGPFTVAAYLIEGGTTSSFTKIKQWMWKDPETLLALLDRITQVTIDYLHMQEQAGVHALQIFESWANILNLEQLNTFSLPFINRIIKSCTVPTLLFSKDACRRVAEFVSVQPGAISFDCSESIEWIEPKVPATIALQGNLDPDVLFASHGVIEEETARLLHQVKNKKRFIFNLGHGMKPQMDPSALQVLVDRVRLGWNK